MQQVVIAGYLGRDPEMRYTPQGTPVTNMSVATTRKWSQDGELREETIWWKVSVWKGAAEAANKYLKKGSFVIVTGQLKAPQVYQKRDGSWDASLEFAFAQVDFGPRTESHADYGNQAEPTSALGDEEILF
jgi:single-strand DNA-binding protein